MEPRAVGDLYVMGLHAPSFLNTTKVFLFLFLRTYSLPVFLFLFIHLQSTFDIVSSSSSVVLHTEFRRETKNYCVDRSTFLCRAWDPGMASTVFMC
jgi:hypothetical protein